MNVNEYLKSTMSYKETNTSLGKLQSIRPRIECADGFSLSVQAGQYMYCSPRQDGMESYRKVEVGFPSERPPETWAEYFSGEWRDHNIKSYLKYLFSNLSIRFAIKRGIWAYLKRLLKYSDPTTESVYAFIPVEMVDALVKSHGGIVVKSEQVKE